VNRCGRLGWETKRKVTPQSSRVGETGGGEERGGGGNETGEERWRGGGGRFEGRVGSHRVLY